MGLKDTIKETKAKLNEVLEEEKELEQKSLEKINEVVKEVAEEPKKEQPEVEEVKIEEKKVEEKPKTDSEFAQERIAKKREKDRLADELTAAKERIAALEEGLKKSSISTPEVPKEPDPSTHPLEWTAWKIAKQQEVIENLSGWKAEQDTLKKRETLEQQAKREVEGFESQIRGVHKDYDDVKDYYARMLMASIKIVNPKISQQNLIKTVENRLLTRASELLAEGYENPLEAMYLEAKQLGYQPRAKQEDKEEVKPDLEKVAKYRSRNAGMAGSSGSGGEAEVTARVAVTMTNAEFAKLKPDQKKRLFESLRG